MEKKLPKSATIPLGVAFVVTAVALLAFGLPMVIGKGDISFPLKKGK